MVIKFITKHSSKYLLHKRQACYWSKVGDIIPLSLSSIISTVLPVVSQSGVSFISKRNCNCVAILSWQDVNVFIQYPCSPAGPGAFQFFALGSCFFNLSMVEVMFSCFTVLLSCLSALFNHFASSLCVTGWSHIPLHYLTLSWLPGLMSLLLFSFSSLSNNFAWFV